MDLFTKLAEHNITVDALAHTSEVDAMGFDSERNEMEFILVARHTDSAGMKREVRMLRHIEDSAFVGSPFRSALKSHTVTLKANGGDSDNVRHLVETAIMTMASSLNSRVTNNNSEESERGVTLGLFAYDNAAGEGHGKVCDVDSVVSLSETLQSAYIDRLVANCQNLLGDWDRFNARTPINTFLEENGLRVRSETTVRTLVNTDRFESRITQAKASLVDKEGMTLTLKMPDGTHIPMEEESEVFATSINIAETIGMANVYNENVSVLSCRLMERFESVMGVKGATLESEIVSIDMEGVTGINVQSLTFNR